MLMSAIRRELPAVVKQKRRAKQDRVFGKPDPERPCYDRPSQYEKEERQRTAQLKKLLGTAHHVDADILQISLSADERMLAVCLSTSVLFVDVVEMAQKRQPVLATQQFPHKIADFAWCTDTVQPFTCVVLLQSGVVQLHVLIPTLATSVLVRVFECKEKYSCGALAHGTFAHLVGSLVAP